MNAHLMERHALLTLVAIGLILSGLHPAHYGVWLLEVFPVLIGIPLLIHTYERFPLTPSNASPHSRATTLVGLRIISTFTAGLCPIMAAAAGARMTPGLHRHIGPSPVRQARRGAPAPVKAATIPVPVLGLVAGC